MRIRSFQAPTMKDAMALVREELGEDAIILSSFERRRGGGVEVRAAVDQDAVHPPRAPRLNGNALPLAEIEAKLRAQLTAEMRRAGVKLPEDETPPTKTELRGTMEAVLTVLAAHGLPKDRRGPLLAAAKDAGTRDPITALGQGLSKRITMANVPLQKGAPLLLVGPAGTGKTVTAAKLAARRVLAGQPVSLATTDTIRAGALAQLEALAAILGKEVASADCPARLAEIAATAGDGPMVVDTPATNPFNAAEMRDLARFLDAGPSEAVLVLPGGMDMEECLDTVGLFKALGVHRVLVTRLDATRRLGGILAAALDHGVALTEFGTSPYVAEGLKSYDPQGFAAALSAMAKFEAEPGRRRAETTPTAPDAYTEREARQS